MKENLPFPMIKNKNIQGNKFVFRKKKATNLYKIAGIIEGDRVYDPKYNVLAAQYDRDSVI